MQNPSGTEAFLKGWGSLIVATVALIQPWVVGIWKRFFRAGSVDIYETGPLELTYGNWGPSVGMRGTLRALHRDQFIRDIDLVVVKEKDSSTHKLDWVFFRTEKITGLGTEDTSAEIASGFMLLPTQPHRYSILFADNTHLSEIKPIVEELVNEWTTYKTTSAAVRALAQKEDIYTPFSAQKIHVDTYTALDRLMYWEPGKYSLEMRVHTTRPERTFTRNWVFEISKSETERLRLNSVVLCNLACEQASTYYYVNPKYQEPVPPRQLNP